MQFTSKRRLLRFTQIANIVKVGVEKDNSSEIEGKQTMPGLNRSSSPQRKIPAGIQMVGVCPAIPHSTPVRAHRAPQAVSTMTGTTEPATP